MRHCIKFLFFTLMMSAAPDAIHGQIEVVDTSTITDLILNSFNGRGVEISNITFSGEVRQFGVFENANSNLEIQEGIILSSGEAALASTRYVLGSNSEFNSLDDATSNSISTPGDADLDSIAGSQTFNAAVLEFDFIPSANSIRFNYVFASEEYPEFNCSEFNDVFAFLLSGPGIDPPENIARVPGSDFAVAINSINNGTVGALGGELVNCTPPDGTLDNAQYYVDNIGGQWLEYDGLTVILEARAEVIPCETYHFKLAVADVGDPALESAVFLESQSFQSAGLEVALTDLTGDSSMVEGCSDISLMFSFDEPLGTDLQIEYMFTGEALPDVDFSHDIPDPIVFPAGTVVREYHITPIADNREEEQEDFALIYQNPICALKSDTIRMTIFDRGNLEVTPDEYQACENALEQIQLNAGNSRHPHGTYTWSPQSGLSDPGIPNPVATISEDITYTVTHQFGDCVETASVQISTTACLKVYVPNIFSPNGDGINDFFRVFYPQEVPFEYSMTIFNRAGATVYAYEGTNFETMPGWNGTFKGKSAPVGVYTYLIEMRMHTNAVHIKTGSLTLIR